MSLTTEDKKKLSTFLTSSAMRDQVTVSNSWQNFMQTQKQSDAIVINIKSAQAVSKLLATIHEINKGKSADQRIIVRAAAGGKSDSYSSSYSATSVVNSDLVIRLTGDEFSNITRIDNTNNVRVGASMQIGPLDKALYDKFNLSLPTSSLIPYVTAAGLAAAGGHGTGKDQPSFAGLIRGLTLCLETGEIVHIDQTHPDFATIVGAHNGLFGIVLDMDIECRPARKMQCVMEKRSAVEFMEAVEEGLFDNDPYVSVMYVPTYLPDELTNRKINNVIIYRWRPVPLDTNNTHHKPLLDYLEQKIQTDLGAAINIPEILRTYPKLIPYYMRYIAGPLNIGDDDELSVGPWNEMMHYRTGIPADLDEICGIFTVKDQPRNAPQGAEIVKAMKHAMMLLDEQAKRGEYPITYALYFRYLQGTNGGLSCTSHPDNHHVCALDLTTNENIKGFAQFKNDMQKFFFEELDTKFHWGKNAPFDLDYEKLYGERWHETKNTLEKWHREHNINTEKSMLLNPLFSNVLDYPAPSLLDTDTLPAHVRKTEKTYKVACNASKLANLITDNSEECKQIKHEINTDMQRTRTCFFFPKNEQPKETETAEKKSACVIL